MEYRPKTTISTEAQECYEGLQKVMSSRLDTKPTLLPNKIEKGYYKWIGANEVAKIMGVSVGDIEPQLEELKNAGIVECKGRLWKEWALVSPTGFVQSRYVDYVVKIK